MQRYQPPAGDTSVPVAPAGITLTFDERSRARLRGRLDDGREAGLFVDRGGVLRDGDLLCTKGGVIVRVRAASEQVTGVYCEDALAQARLCYHLGNRHVALEINPGRVAYRTDHVLDELVRGLGLQPLSELAPFEPESGAYGHGHSHSHS